MRKLIKWFFKILRWFLPKPVKKSVPSTAGAFIAGFIRTENSAGAVIKGVGVELSVAIPMFRAKYIGWLPLEGLIRQQNINFKWELVIAEEVSEEPFGEKNIRAYESRLKDIGCVRIVYKGLKKWIPLSDKWVLLANMCDKDSKIFVIHAADNYSAPLRLARHYEIFMNNEVHLHIPTKAIYYDILTRKTILHDITAAGRKDDCAARAMLTGVVRRLPKVGKKSGVDGWLRKAARNVVGRDTFKIFYDEESNNWKYGLNTHGLNNIMSRRQIFKVVEGKFKVCSVDINKTIPEDILEELNRCRKLVEKHKRGLPILAL